MYTDHTKNNFNKQHWPRPPYVLIKEYHDLVESIAKHLIARFPPNIQLDDLVQAGMIGLLEADTKFDQTKGANFKTYAGIRIRGAMLDEIRKGDWTPRSVYRFAREVTAAIKVIENLMQRDAKDSEIAHKLDISLEEYYQKLKDIKGVRIFGFEDLGIKEDNHFESKCSYSLNPVDSAQKSQFKEHMAEKIQTLPEKEKMVLALYYEEELNLKEIGEILGVSESRISQILSSAMLRLQSRLKCLK